MQIIRTILAVTLLALTLGGCTIIRGTAAGPNGEAWYVRAGYYTGKVKGVYYCPPDGGRCVEARTVSREDYERLTASTTTGDQP